MALIVKSKIRKYLDGLNLGEDLVIELERKVDKILKKAAERAKGNGRRTVYARDL
jgi:histone H3/H4